MGQLRANFHDLMENGNLGDWCFVESQQGDHTVLNLFLRYPVPDDLQNEVWRAEHPDRGDIIRLPLTPGIEKPWDWDGNRESPTVTPSIHVIGRWHGYFTNGQLVTLESR